MRHDGLVLMLLWREFRGAIAGMRLHVRVSIALGSGLLLAYGMADAVSELRRAAPG